LATDLLTDIRMTLAANELNKSSLSTGAVAEAVGYQSEAAFQRALQEPDGRHSGTVAQSPGAVRPGRLRKASSPADAKPAETPKVDPHVKRRRTKGGDASSLA